MPNLTLLGIFIAGFLTFLSPCILPLMPLYLSYITGNSYDDALDNKKMLYNNILASVGFSIGLMIVFTLLGMTATTLGKYLTINKEIFGKVSGVIIIIFGLFHMGIINLKFLSIEKNFKLKQTSHPFFNALLLGMAFSIGWTPCISPILGSVLLLCANSGTIYLGVLYMLIFSIGFSIPFIITSVLLNSVMLKLNKYKKFLYVSKLVTGFIIIVIGIILFIKI